MQEFIEFKWEKFSFKFHLIGVCMHILYVISLANYVKHVYVDAMHDIGNFNTIMLFILFLAILYPFTYDTMQLYKLGRS
jgi:hypothetical protein